MPTSAVLIELAALVHRAWCEQMLAASWRYGPEFDEAARTHDALVSFDRLHRLDRRRSLRAIEGSGLLGKMVGVLEHAYVRGPDREFAVEEMRVGLPVGVSHGPGEIPGAGAEPRGVIESWETDAEGELALIRVRWEDGALREHHPAAMELRRV